MTYSYQKIWSISLPILFGMFIQQLIGLTDTAFLGRVGTVELGASALAGVFYIMIFMLALGFGIGVQIITARRNGEGRQDKIGEVIYQGISILLAAAVVIIFLVSAGAPAVLREMISSPAVYQKSLDYLNIRIYGFLFAFPIVIFRSFYVGITKTRVLTWSAVVMLLVNVGLDYALIFGKLGAPAMGIKGAALASVISEAIAMLFFIVYMLLRTNLQKYGLQHPIIYNRKVLQQILNLSVWTMLQYFISLATWFLFLVAIERLGENELAISNILRSVSVFPYMVVTALGAAANAITSNLIGAGRSEEILSTSTRIVKMGYGIGTALVVLMALFPRPMLRIYTNDPALVAQAIPAYYASLSTFFTLVPGMILLSVVSGTGQTKTALYMEIISMTLYMLNVWYVVIHLRADLYICWTSEHSYNILLTILTYVYLWHRLCCRDNPAENRLPS